MGQKVLGEKSVAICSGCVEVAGLEGVSLNRHAQGASRFELERVGPSFRTHGFAHASVAGAATSVVVPWRILTMECEVRSAGRKLLFRPTSGQVRVLSGYGHRLAFAETLTSKVEAAGILRNAKNPEAAKALVAEGFQVLAYTNEDVVMALRLEDAGCAAVMPLASPIGSGLGLVNPYYIREIKTRLAVPVIVDAGVGTASDACVTMEQGVDGILMNTALAAARNPVAMATAMRLAVDAGRLAWLAGRMPKREWAVPSSPTTGMLD